MTVLARAAFSAVAATALALAPVAAEASDRESGRRFAGGIAPLALVRPLPQPPPELTPRVAALIETARLPDHLAPDELPLAVEAAAAAGVEVYHEVAAGEHLSALAGQYGLVGDDAWRRLFDANPEVDDPNQLEAGTRLRIPGPGERLERRELPSVAVAGAGRGSGALAGGAGVWDRLAQCESGGRWHLDTGNGYFGGLQFSLRSWQAVGGTGYPHEHSRETQIAMAERLRAVQGWGAWPSCSRRLGLR